MKLSLKSIFAALIIGVSVSSCGFGGDGGSSTSTISYGSDDLIYRVQKVDGTVLTPTAPQIIAKYTSDSEKSVINFQFNTLNLSNGAVQFTTPDLNVTFTEEGMSARSMAFTAGTVDVLDFNFQVIGGSWMYISMTVNGESVQLCTSWIWNASNLIQYGYPMYQSNAKVILLGGATTVYNPVTDNRVTNEKAQFGIVFKEVKDPNDDKLKNKVVDLYVFNNPFDGSTTTQSTSYLFESLSYSLEANGIFITTNAPVVAKKETKFDSTADPDMVMTSLSVYLPYTAKNARISYVATGDNVSVSCDKLELVSQISITD